MIVTTNNDLTAFLLWPRYSCTITEQYTSTWLMQRTMWESSYSQHDTIIH